MIGTLEGHIPNKENLDNEASLPDLSYCSGLNHINLSNKRVQFLLRHLGKCKCRLVDPIGNVDPTRQLWGLPGLVSMVSLGTRPRKTLALSVSAISTTYGKDLTKQ